ncbi:MAG TPA: hypothetical protein VFS20_08920 [Longimicrobium sp.]|nr:hypothetical protein [Longimicrobium sp.]
MKALFLTVLVVPLCTHAAAAQAPAPAPGPQWASIASPRTRLSSWMDTTSVEAVGPDRFRIRTLLILPAPMPVPDRGRFDRSAARVEYDCAQRTTELLEGQWLMGETVVFTVTPTGRAEPWHRSQVESSERACEIARRVSGRGSAPADSAAAAPPRP